MGYTTRRYPYLNNIHYRHRGLNADARYLRPNLTPRPHTSPPFSRNFLANQIAMFLGLRKPSRSSRPSTHIVSDNPILYHMMSLDPNCPRFVTLLAELLQSRTELKNLKKAEDDRVLKLADFLYGVSIAKHPRYLVHISADLRRADSG